MVARTPHVPTILIGVLLTAAVSTAGQEIDKRFEKGAVITLQGCVTPGERSGSFVFGRVTVWPVATSPNGEYGPRHFWLANAAAILADHVGETVQVKGTISDLSESEIEREPGLSRAGDRVAIELPTGDILTSPAYAGIPPDQLDSKTDMKVTLVKVKVDSLLTVMKTCLPGVK